MRVEQEGGDTVSHASGHDVSMSPFLGSRESAISLDIAALGTLRTYDTGEFIYRQGEISPRFFQIRSGCVRIFATLPDGSERVMGYARVGASFGESGCFDGLPRYASSIAMEPSDVVVIHKEDLVAASTGNPALMLEVARRLAHKQRVLGLRVLSDGLPARARVAVLLLQLAGAYGQAGSDAAVAISARHRLDELALLVGVTRVTFSRELSRLISEGIVQKRGRDLVIVDVSALETIVQSHVG